VAEQQAELDGMPEPAVLRRVVRDGRCVVSVGRSVVYDVDVADTGMRNLAVVALTDSGRSVTEVAAVFGVTATYVSMLRGRAAGTARPGWSAGAAGRPSSASGRWPRFGGGPARDVPRPGSRPGTGWPARW
jgi:hypothetical protein